MKKLTDKMYLFSGIIFAIISLLALVLDKNKTAFIAGITIAILCIIFNFIFRVKWNNLAREGLINACNEIKSFGNSLPLAFLGKFQIIWIILLIITLFDNIITKFVPIPDVLFTVLGNIAFAFFLFGTFYQIFQGNIKGFSGMTALFSTCNLIDVIISYFLNNHVVSTRSMCLFLVFWALHNIFSIMLLEEEPIQIEKEEKPKKDKKTKKTKKENVKKEEDKENKEIEDKEE